jgi:cellulose synthase (UDP-forming)
MKGELLAARPSGGRSWREILVRSVAALALTWGAVYLGWRILVTWHHTEPVLFFLLFACEVFGWVMLAGFCFLAWRIPETTRPELGQPRSVDVFLCTYDEGAELLEATLVGCAGITHPHTTWVLDDGRREAVRALAERNGARYLTRSDNLHAKAGNINEALTRTNGELILVLDADHVPQPDILDATVGYFEDPRMALVQTPQDFGNHDSFQHFSTGRHDQSMFFEVILPGKDRHNGVFWCGSAAVIRRDALLDVGGVATETIAEDFHTTIKMHTRHWRTRYHGETLVQGLAPHDLASYLLQRDRWARGNLNVLRTRENPLIATDLSVAQRMSYLTSLLSYFVPLQRVGLLLVLTIMLVTGQLPMHASVAGFFIFWLPWVVLEMTASSLLSRGRMNMWDGTYSLMLTLEIFSRATLVLIKPVKATFKVTPKDGFDDGGFRALRQLHLLSAMTLMILAAIVFRVLASIGVVHLPPLLGPPLAIGLALAIWELSLMSAVLILVMRRKQLRRQYRRPTEVTGIIGDTIVRVVDLTTEGVGLVSPQPLDLAGVVELVVELPSVEGHDRTVRLQLTVTACRPTDQEGEWRIGGMLAAPRADDHAVLTEYCHVVAARRRLTASGRLQARSDEAQGILEQEAVNS